MATSAPTMPLSMPSTRISAAVSRRSWLLPAVGRNASDACSSGVFVNATRFHRLHSGWCAASSSALSRVAVLCRAGGQGPPQGKLSNAGSVAGHQPSTPARSQLAHSKHKPETITIPSTWRSR